MERLIADALLLARESVGESAAEQDYYGFPDVRDYLRSIAGECATRAILETPVMSLTGWRALSGKGFRVEAGRGLLPLPSDLLMVTGLKLSGWVCEAGKILPSDHPLRVWQSRGVDGLKGSPERPMAFHTVIEGDAGVELWPAEGGDRLESGWYQARPEDDGSGEIAIPESCYRKTLDHMVLTLRQYATMR